MSINKKMPEDQRIALETHCQKKPTAPACSILEKMMEAEAETLSTKAVERIIRCRLRAAQLRGSK